jgi:TRAP-type C4-dicarboxylate transport system substrate-binding protein
MKRDSFGKLLVILTSVFLLGSFVTATPAGAEVIKWRLECSYPGNSLPGKFSFKWAKDIQEITCGKLQVQFAEPGSIVPPSEIFQATSKGVLQAGATFGSFYNALMPETDIEVGLPFAWQNIFEIHDAYMNRGLLEELRKVYAEHNLYYVCPFYANIINGIGLKKPVRKPADFKGLKIRDLGIQAEWIRSHGASAMVIPGGEIYMALKLGTIDGFHFGVSGLEDYKLGEVIDYYLLEPHTGSLPLNLFVNMDAWKALPDDVKYKIEKYSQGTSFKNMMDFDENRRWIKHSKKYGLEGIRWSKEDIEATYAWAINVLWEKVADKSPRCRRLVEIIKQQARDLGKIQ